MNQIVVPGSVPYVYSRVDKLGKVHVQVRRRAPQPAAPTFTSDCLHSARCVECRDPLETYGSTMNLPERWRCRKCQGLVYDQAQQTRFQARMDLQFVAAIIQRDATVIQQEGLRPVGRYGRAQYDDLTFAELEAGRW